MLFLILSRVHVIVQILLLQLSTSTTTISAFTIAPTVSSRLGVASQHHYQQQQIYYTVLKAQNDDAKESNEPESIAQEEDEEEDVGDVMDAAAQEDNSDDADEEDDEENTTAAMVASLKEQIASMESALKGKQATMSRLEEDVDKYTSSGYARRVAQMEDMRRVRLTMQSSNKETAKAAVVQNFLPVLDDLRALKDEFGETDFGSKYSGLTGAMMSALKELGVEEYAVTEGEAVLTKDRVSVVDEAYSDTIPRGSVLRAVSPGMEIDGNVMRMAQAVVSLGPAPDDEKSSGDAEEEKEEEAAPSDE